MIGIISDTHDRLETIARALDVFRKNDVKMIFHCGDWVAPFTIEYYDKQNITHIPTRSVFGNNEGDIKRILERNSNLKTPIEFAPKLVFDFNVDNRHIAIFHGHDKAILNSLIKCNCYDAVFTGHTHVVRNEYIGRTLVFNPGSTCYAANSSIIKQASVGIYNPKTNKAKIIYI